MISIVVTKWHWWVIEFANEILEMKETGILEEAAVPSQNRSSHFVMQIVEQGPLSTVFRLFVHKCSKRDTH